jgi:hypothetical protein
MDVFVQQLENRQHIVHVQSCRYLIVIDLLPTLPNKENVLLSFLRMTGMSLTILKCLQALPAAFPSVVVAAVHSLFDRISNMDTECRTRLILWFSHHL